MRSAALKIQEYRQDNARTVAMDVKTAHLHVVTIREESSEYGPDLGAFEEKYFMGAAAFA